VIDVKVGDRVIAKLSTGTIMSGIVDCIGTRFLNQSTQVRSEKDTSGELDAIWATNWVITNGDLAGTLFAGGGSYYVTPKQIIKVEESGVLSYRRRMLRFEESLI